MCKQFLCNGCFGSILKWLYLCHLLTGVYMLLSKPGLCHLAPWHNDPTISVKGNSFLLTGFQPWGRGWRWCRKRSCSKSSFPTRPRASVASQKATCQNHAQKFPISLSVFKPVMHTDLHPLLECALVGFRVTILWQQLPPSGSGVRYSQPPCSSSGKHVLSYTGSWWSPGKHTS